MLVGSASGRVRNVQFVDRDEETPERLLFQISSRRWARGKWVRTWINCVIWRHLVHRLRSGVVDGVNVVAFGEIIQNEHTRVLEMTVDHLEALNRVVQPSQKVTFTIQPSQD